MSCMTGCFHTTVCTQHVYPFEKELLLFYVSGVFGAVPQSLIDDEEDFLRHAHSINSDLVSMCMSCSM